MAKRRKFSGEFKAKVVLELVSGKKSLSVELPRFSGDLRAFGYWGTSMQGFVPIG